MAISFPKLMTARPCWFRHEGPQAGDILISTMGRMVRNLPDSPFPGWSSPESRAAVADTLLPVLKDLEVFRNAYHAEMPKLFRSQRMLLLERKLLTPSMAARQDGCHILISTDQSTVALVNEEEHLCLHTSVPGLDTDGVLRRLDGVSAALSRQLTFAANQTDGYLTSLPAEAGDGLQLFATLHLPALVHTDQMQRVRKGLEKLHLNITPFYSEAGEDVGGLFVVFTSAIHKGRTAEDAGLFTRICRLLAEREEDARRLWLPTPEVRDAILRAYAVTKYSCVMDFKEMLNNFSLLRLGITGGLFRRPGVDSPASPQACADMLSEVLALYTTAAPAMVKSARKDILSKEEAQRIRSRHCSIFAGKIEPVPSLLND